MLQNLTFLFPQKDEYGIGLSLDTRSVGHLQLFRDRLLSLALDYKTRNTDAERRRKWLPEVWSPTDLQVCSVPFTKGENTILASSVPQDFGIGKKWGLQHYTLHGQAAVIILQGKAGCRLCPEPDCSCC